MDANQDHNIPKCSKCKHDVFEIDDEGYCEECHHEIMMDKETYILESLKDPPKCYFCDNTETGYCDLCGKWMCLPCSKKYWLRLKTFLKDNLFDFQ
jgi:hypothetical protein|tara:strand:+ start:505 stop:792 length:288 start_codon:yes stop_codon:yes gene_type:complete